MDSIECVLRWEALPGEVPVWSSGSMNRATPEGSGFLYRYDPDGALHRMFGDIEVPNGLAFSPDSTTLYFCDMPARRLTTHALDPAIGRPGPARLFAESAAPGVPESAVTDAEDCLWVAHFDGERLTRYRPGGRIDRVIKLPVPRPTACCFGGDGLVTSGRINLDEATLHDAPNSGSLFAIRPGVCGLPEPMFGQRAA